MKAIQDSSAVLLGAATELPTDVAICIFVKPFVAGQVKTRLIRSLGAEGAVALAEAMFQDTRATVRGIPWAREIVASAAPLAETHAGNHGEVWLQGEGNLGARLERILRRALASSQIAIAIGADSPGLPHRFFEEARRRLQSADSVLGPSEDGGFYLLGLRRCPPGLLDAIAWSRHDTLLQTVSRLRKFGLSTSLLERWFDVDRPDDVARLRSQIAAGELVAPRTAEAIRQLECSIRSSGR